MKNIIILFFSLLISVNSSGFTAEVTYDKGIPIVQYIFNFHIIEPGIIRGGQPNEEGFKILKESCGIKTILNLRGDSQENIAWEKKIAQNLGITFINIPIDNINEKSIGLIDQCLNIISNKTNQPIFIHCQAGKDRTGLISAAYRIKYCNWSIKEALAEMFINGYDKRFSNFKQALLDWTNNIDTK